MARHTTLTRRRFLQYGAVGGAALVLPARFMSLNARAAVGSPNMTKFIEPLPIPPVIHAESGWTGSIAAAESTAYRFHQQLGPARTWGYGGAPYLGPTFEARKNVTVMVEWINNLGQTFIPNDPDIMGAVLPGTDPAPIVAHLHGGFNLPQFDGTPLQWFTNGLASTGPHFLDNFFAYGNEQRATMLWYHDHALGNTRTNVYAGLAGLYFLRDDDDTGLADNPLGLPARPYEVPLVLQDKTFNADGTMFYPNVGLPPHTVWVPEFFGDTPIVNGKAYPFLNVEPRRYRLRIVNGSQARFYGLKFASVGGNSLLPFTVIGAEGGLLRAPVQVTRFVLAPGERADVIVDFAAMPRVTQWVLKNDAKAPFPNGRGGDVPQLMRFNVNLPLNGTDTTTPGPSLVLPTLAPLPAPVGNPREQKLEEQLDPVTGNPVVLHVEGEPYLEASGLPTVSTVPAQGAVEDWLLVNTTGDTHPIHLHLVHFEVIDRRPFNVATYMAGGGLVYTGPAVPAPAWENGLKDTVQAHPGEVTRIRARFDLPTYGTIDLPAGVTRPQYVWHCHILEHEENDMMRAFEVETS